METIVAVIILAITVVYAVFIAVSIAKGKSWAVDIARAISMLDPQSVSFDLRQRALESLTARDRPAADLTATAEQERDRLAA